MFRRKDIMETSVFYRKMSQLTSQDSYEYKNSYLKEITNNRIYKFIQFTDDEQCNASKLQSIYNGNLWFGCFWTMNDPTEFSMKRRGYEFKSRYEKWLYDFQVAHIQEMYTLCSFTSCINETMWSEYANEGNGCCLCLHVRDFDWFYPVEYIDKKSKYSFVPMWREALVATEQDWNGEIPNITLALAPYFFKDRVNRRTGQDSSKENEIRAIFCAFTEDELNSGVLVPGYKKEHGIRGNNVSWFDLNLELEQIIIGETCSSRYIDGLQKYGKREGVCCMFQNL